MVRKRTVASVVLAASGAAVLIDRFTGVEIVKPVMDLYSQHPLAAGLATAAGLDFLGYISSRNVRKANNYVISGFGRGVRALYRNARHHPRAWGIGFATTVAAGALVLGAVNARNYSSLENKLNNVQLKQGPQGIQGVQGVPGTAPSEQDIARAVEAYINAHPLPTVTPAPDTAPTPAPAAYEFSNAVKNAQSLNLSTQLIKGMFSGIDAKTLVGKLNINSAEVSLVSGNWSDGNPSNGELLDKNGFSATYDGDAKATRIYAVVDGKNVAVQGTGVSKDALLGLLKDYAMKGQAQRDLVTKGVVPVPVK